MTKQPKISPYVINAVEYFVRDEENKYYVLEQYYNDIYKLFLTKLSKFDCQAITANDERKKLKALLDEIIYVKGLLEEVNIS